MVLVSLPVAGNNVITFYAISINLQAFIPISVSIIPRYMFSVVATAVYFILFLFYFILFFSFDRLMLPPIFCINSVVSISIVGAHRSYITITSILGLLIIGCWTSMYTSMIFLVEHLYFRKNDHSSYDSDKHHGISQYAFHLE